MSDRPSFGYKLRKDALAIGPALSAPKPPLAAVPVVTPPAATTTATTVATTATDRRLPGKMPLLRLSAKVVRVWPERVFLCVTGGHLGMTRGSATVAGYRARVASTRQTATVSARPVGQAWYRRGGPLLAVGAAAFGVALAGYIIFALTSPSHQWMDPVDLRVYTDGGLIVRHVRPFYRAFRAAPLYDWPGYAHLPFTYSPFAAMVFTAGSVVSFKTLAQISVGVNLAAMLGCVWMTLGGLGCRRGLARLGATLLLAAPLLWTEPIQRTLFLGQIEIVLMTLIIWDQVQPDRRWWKGAGIGIGAGIDLIPLIFIPYLVLAGKLRQAAVATGVFATTVVIGFIALPHDSVTFWLTGYFLHAGDFSNTSQGSLLNQSLLALVTRTPAGAGSVAGLWLGVAAVVGCLGLLAAAALARTGRPTAGWVTCAVTGVLISPISWDNHWIWIVPLLAVLADAGFRARGAARWGFWGFGAALAAVFADWPAHWTGRLAFVPHGLVGFDVRRHPMSEIFHLNGIQLVSWNLFVLGGLAMFGFLVALAWLAWRNRTSAAAT